MLDVFNLYTYWPYFYGDIKGKELQENLDAILYNKVDCGGFWGFSFNFEINWKYCLFAQDNIISWLF